MPLGEGGGERSGLLQGESHCVQLSEELPNMFSKVDAPFCNSLHFEFLLLCFNYAFINFMDFRYLDFRLTN